jgi:hypothetical protein
LPDIALSVVSEEISYIGHPNPLLKCSGGIRQTTKRLERFVDAWRQTRTEHASLLWERIVRNQVHMLSDLGHPSL